MGKKRGREEINSDDSNGDEIENPLKIKKKNEEKNQESMEENGKVSPNTDLPQLVDQNINVPQESNQINSLCSNQQSNSQTLSNQENSLPFSSQITLLEQMIILNQNILNQYRLQSQSTGNVVNYQLK